METRVATSCHDRPDAPTPDWPGSKSRANGQPEWQRHCSLAPADAAKLTPVIAG